MSLRFLSTTVFLVLACESTALAEETYNFYFEKEKKAQQQEEIQKKTEVKNEPLVQQKVKTKKKEKSSNDGRKWSLRFGRGQISVNQGLYSYTTPNSKDYSASAYIVGANYKYSRYIDFEAIHLIPIINGTFNDENASSYGEFKAGGALTPFQIDLFGRPFLFMSFLAGGILGQRTNDMDLSYYLGGRLKFYIVESVALHIGYRKDIKFDSTYSYELSVAYNF